MREFAAECRGGTICSRYRLYGVPVDLNMRRRFTHQIITGRKSRTQHWVGFSAARDSHEQADLQPLSSLTGQKAVVQLFGGAELLQLKSADDGAPRATAAVSASGVADRRRKWSAVVTRITCRSQYYANGAP